MKKRLITMAGIFALALLLCTMPMAAGAVRADVKDWTVLVFLNGDNNLESYAIDDLNEMERVGSDDNVNIVVQIDRTWGYDSSNGDWTGTRRYYVTQDFNTFRINSDLIEDLGERNMGTPSELVNFVNWGIDNYPADHYFVDCWDHGDGWYKDAGGPFKAFSYDESSYAEIGVANGELREAVSAIASHLGRKVDLWGFDACLMGMFEVGYELKDAVGGLVASEETISVNGWRYDLFLAELTANPMMSALDLGESVARNFVSGIEATLSVVDLTTYDDLAAAVDTFAAELIAADEAGFGNAISQRINLSQSFYEYDFHDLYHFAQGLQGAIVPTSLKNAASAVLIAVDAAVYANYARAFGYANSHGISIMLPDGYMWESSYRNLRSSVDTEWDDFIFSFSGGGGGSCSLAPTGQGTSPFRTAAYVIPMLVLLALVARRRRHRNG